MNTIRTWLLAWVVGLGLMPTASWVHGAGTATITVPSYTTPGYLIRRLDADSVLVRAEFTQSFPAKGKRTLRSTWQLLDDQGKPVGIHLKGGLERGNDSVGEAHTVTVAVANAGAAASVPAARARRAAARTPAPRTAGPGSRAADAARRSCGRRRR